MPAMKNCVIILLLILGYTHVYSQKSVTRHDSSSRTKEHVPSNNDIIRQQAQKYLPRFIDSLAQHGADRVNYAFHVKAEFRENGRREQLWSQVFIYRDGSFAGILMDSPELIGDLKRGDRIVIKAADVEDWIIDNFHSGKQTGYFSEDYLDKGN